MSGEHMQFPPTWENFIDLYGFIDRENIYTNGSELIQTFRVKQMIEHYFPFNQWKPISEPPKYTGDYLIEVDINHAGEGMFTYLRVATYNTLYEDWYVHENPAYIIGKIYRWTELSEPLNNTALGKWIVERDANNCVLRFHCSICDKDFHHIGVRTAYQYCPLCGAKMENKRVYEENEV